jgi:hypothetical protein
MSEAVIPVSNATQQNGPPLCLSFYVSTPHMAEGYSYQPLLLLRIALARRKKQYLGLIDACRPHEENTYYSIRILDGHRNVNIW